MNSLGASVLSTEEGKAKYDQTMLNVLSDKQVLAWILKRFVSEYEHLPLEEIETKYIEPETILVSKAGVSRDSSGSKGFQRKTPRRRKEPSITILFFRHIIREMSRKRSGSISIWKHRQTIIPAIRWR
ncbi:MAG: hypothetical protein V8S36_03280 [Lachnospiraceae bacterium]